MGRDLKRRVVRRWIGRDRSRHINEVELLAALQALKSFTSQASRVAVLILDNITVVHYVNNSGGSRSGGLCRISAEIIAWCKSRSITINAGECLPSRCPKYSCRSPVKGPTGLKRLDAKSGRLHKYLIARWSLKVDLFASL